MSCAQSRELVVERVIQTAEVFYDGAFSDALRRQEKVVAMGHRQYSKSLSSGRQEFFLRRNIPTLEKGLAVRPRRQTLAVDYMKKRVKIFGRLGELLDVI